MELSLGNGVEQNYEKALEWYHNAADLGVAEAMFYVGKFHPNGKGVEQSHEKALEWYHMAADLENSDAMFYIGAY